MVVFSWSLLLKSPLLLTLDQGKKPLKNYVPQFGGFQTPSSYMNEPLNSSIGQGL